MHVLFETPSKYKLRGRSINKNQSKLAVGCKIISYIHALKSIFERKKYVYLFGGLHMYVRI
jgi:hypothetical protein